MEDRNRSCVLLLGLPNAAFCGIDLLSFTSSPRFKGVKQLPPGWHFVFVGATNSFSLRYGAWFEVQYDSDPSPNVLVKQWSAQNEELVAVTDETELQRWRANLGAIWREGLTPYRQSVTDGTKSEGEPVEEKRDWGKMTDCISATLLSRITGLNTPDHWALTSASCAEIDYDDIPGLSQAESVLHPEKSLGFLPVDLKQTWAEGTVGRARTEAARDRSWALEQIASTHCKSTDEIIGEIQFCFLMVLTLNNNSCLEQWKRLLSLLLTCSQAVLEKPKFFVRFLVCLRLQLEHCQDAEGGLFDLSDDGGNLLNALLQKFRRGLEQLGSAPDQRVWDELEDLDDLLRAERGWAANESQPRKGMLQLEDGEQVMMETHRFDEDDETGEYAPTIVDLDEEEMEALEKEYGAEAMTKFRTSTKQAEPRGAYEPESEEEDDEDIEDLDERY